MQVKSLGEIYNNYDEIEFLYRDSILEITIPDSDFTRILNQIKASKTLNTYTDKLGEFTTIYKPKNKQRGITIKVTCIGERIIDSKRKKSWGDKRELIYTD